MYGFNDENKKENIENAKGEVVYNVVLGCKGRQWSPMTFLLCIVLMMKMKEKV